MTIFVSEDFVSYGNPKNYFFVLVSDKVAELIAFTKRLHGSLTHVPADVREILDRAKSAELTENQVAALKTVNGMAVRMNLSLPDRGVNMHKSKTPIRTLLPFEQEFVIKREEPCFVPKEYIPLLNMMMREQYSHLSGVGQTEEAAAFFKREIRGKLIDLCRSGKIIDDPEDWRLEKFHQQLENIDLGRRSGLKIASTQSEEESELSEKFAKGEEKRRRDREGDRKPPTRDIPDPVQDETTAAWEAHKRKMGLS